MAKKKKKMLMRECRGAPCTKCPWLKDSFSGWLGASSPERFVLSAIGEVHLPCHMTLNYEDPQVLNKWEGGEVGKLCAGTLVFLRNNLIRPRDSQLVAYQDLMVRTDGERVFQRAQDFIDHHRMRGVGSWSAEEDALGLHAWKVYKKVRFVPAVLGVIAHFDLTGELLDDI